MGQGKTFSNGRSGNGLATNGGKEAQKDRIDDIIKKNPLIRELIDNGAKVNVPDLVFVTKDKTGMTIWLENGNSNAGLVHILDGNGQKLGHAQDFEKAYGIHRDQVAGYIKKVISRGNMIKNSVVDLGGGRKGLERIYYYQGKYHLLTAVGTNGFLVSAHPYKYKGK